MSDQIIDNAIQTVAAVQAKENAEASWEEETETDMPPWEIIGNQLENETDYWLGRDDNRNLKVSTEEPKGLSVFMSNKVYPELSKEQVENLSWQEINSYYPIGQEPTAAYSTDDVAREAIEELEKLEKHQK
jgi:hypothetical protein